MKVAIEAIAKIIAINYADWRAYLGKAKKVLDYIKSKREKDLFDKF